MIIFVAIFWLCIIAWAVDLYRGRAGLIGWLPWICAAVLGFAVFGFGFFRSTARLMPTGYWLSPFRHRTVWVPAVDQDGKPRGFRVPHEFFVADIAPTRALKRQSVEILLPAALVRQNAEARARPAPQSPRRRRARDVRHARNVARHQGIPHMALTDAQWAELKKAYEGGESVLSLAKRFPVSRPTIIAHRDKAGWTLQPNLQVSKTEARALRERTTAKVIDIATGKAIDRMEKSGKLDDLSDTLAVGLAKHTSIASRLMDAADKLLEDFVNDKDAELASTREGRGRDVIIRQGRAELFNQIVSGVRNAVGGQPWTLRESRPGMPSVGDENTSDDLFYFEDAVDPDEQTA